ncbi:STAS domain-containing protein [Amycolatopsis sp. NBC_01488]|uniref:STAS domain-containing protein n=1 Tax=Amycolatopsis sp. NBC_01488 TaxID=2903563 RepID=UPI002E2C1DFF|nr:STAS domain-containing protein [Amycolatopsis sp. NBC_01488]
MTSSLTTTILATDHPDVLHLAVAGDLDYDSAPALRTTLGALPLGTGTGLIIDLSALTFCDSSGLSTLIAAHQLTRTTGSALALAAVPPRLLTMFRLTGMEPLLPLYPAMEDARRAVQEALS